MDWNDDGRLDIIVGDRLGTISYFSRLSSGDIFLTTEPKITVDGKPIYVGHNSAPSIVDWNNDGLPDIVTGRMEGIPSCLYLYINEGIIGESLFNQTDTVFCSGEPIHLYSSYPDFGDLNNDGLLDLIVGSTTGRIVCYTNSGTPDLPVFEDYEYLRADGKIIDFYSSIRPSICDWNDDGIPDILAANYTGTINLFLGEPDTEIEEGERISMSGLALNGFNNPASDFIQSSIELWSTAVVSIAIYSLDGRLLNTLFNGILDSGTHLLQLDIDGIPSGVYLFVISTGQDRICRSLVVLD